ncbi:hypothetical protein ES703_80676 [subsurface metagenome]
MQNHSTDIPKLFSLINLFVLPNSFLYLYQHSTAQYNMTKVKEISLTLDTESNETKLQQLINEILRVIQIQLNPGESLPSINNLSRQLNISRDTVFKAYRELKRRKLVDSTPTKGYFVSSEINKVLLLLDYYSPFKDIVYQEFEKNLDSSYSIDLVFHHYNIKLFESVVLQSIGRYNAYVIMNFDTQQLKISEVLRKIDPSKLLFLDIPITDWKDFDREKYSYVWQDFDTAVYESLSSIKDKIIMYNTFNLVFPDHLRHPSITTHAFRRFCEVHQIQYRIMESIKSVRLQKKDAYFILRQKDLAYFLAACKTQSFETGKDLGILAYNDSPLYEFVNKGISVISTNFNEMGKKACRFVNNHKPIKEIIPTSIILRKSL